MLAFLGWNPGTTQEIFSIEQLVDAFTLERVSKAGAKFDPEKTKWFQQQYLRSKENKTLAAILSSSVNKAVTDDHLETICGMMKERATFPEDIIKDGEYLFENPSSYDEKMISKKWKSNTDEIMNKWKEILLNIDDFNSQTIETKFKDFLTSNELGFGAVLLPFRILVTGVGAGPGMFDIAAFLGKQEVLSRMESGLNHITKIKHEA